MVLLMEGYFDYALVFPLFLGLNKTNYYTIGFQLRNTANITSKLRKSDHEIGKLLVVCVKIYG